MKEKMEIKNLDDLFEAVLCLENIDECRLFFKDLCTVPELKALSQRFQEWLKACFVRLLQVQF